MPPAKVKLTGCGDVVTAPFVARIRELGNNVMVTLATGPHCVMATVCPATVKDPTLLDGLLFAAADQLTVLPEAVAVTQDEFELAAGPGQVLVLGVTTIVPEPPATGTVRLVGLSV